MILQYCIFGITFLTNFLLGLFVFLRNPRHSAHQQYAAFTAAVLAWILSLFLYYFFSQPVVVLGVGRVNFAVALFVPFFFYRFIAVFPKETVKLSRFVTLTMTLLTGVLCVLTLLTPLIDANEQVIGADRSTVFGSLFPLYVLAFFLPTALSIWLLFTKYRQAKGLIRVQLQYLIFGFLLAMTIGTLTNLVLPYGFHISQLQVFGPVTTILFLGCVTYAMVRHRFFNIRLVLTRAVVYAVLVLLLGSFYAVDIFLISQYFFQNKLQGEEEVIYALLALFIAVTFSPLKTLLESASEQVFFRDHYQTHDLVFRLTKCMASTLELNMLTQQTLQQIMSSLHISRGALLIFKDEAAEVAAFAGYPDAPTYDNAVIDLLFTDKRMRIFEEEEQENIRCAMQNANISLSLPLYDGEQKEGLLLLGEKKSGEIYSPQDISVLEIFGPEVSVAIRNAKSYAQINRFNHTLTDEVEKATTELQTANDHLRASNAQLQAANDKLQELDRLKDDFVSVASHELRTPMTSIKSYLWMPLANQGGVLCEKHRYYVQRAYNSVDRLIKLVNDMLNISRIESGRLTVQVQSVQIDQVVQDVLEEVRQRAQELGVTLALTPCSELPAVLADPEKIKEVLYNLVGNSLKFTPQGGTITVSFARKEQMVEVTVHDTGAGIASENLPKLFQKYGILPGSYVTNQPTFGTGLGLYICRSLIEVHGGTIQATSEGKGKGTTVTFSLQVYSDNALREFQALHPQPAEEQIGLIHTQL